MQSLLPVGYLNMRGIASHTTMKLQSSIPFQIVHLTLNILHISNHSSKFLAR